MEMFKEILGVLTRLVILPAIPILAVYIKKALTSWAEAKAVEVENETIAEYLLEITEIITQAVISTTQTYVEALKEKGEFNEEAQEHAFDETKFVVMTLLAEEAKEFLEMMYGDAELWIDTKIEQIVKETKVF